MAAMLAALLAFIVVASPQADRKREELAKPEFVKSGGKRIDVDGGHAAPFLADVDGDGKQDLLVGQYIDGRLRVYANMGDRRRPRFGKFRWFEAGGALGKTKAG